MTGPITPETLARQLENTDAKSIDDILPCLPTEFRKNFTFVHQSSALFPECSDALHPRIILFSEDGSTLITLPGDLPGKNCNQIDVVNFEAGRLHAGTVTLSKKWRVDHAPASCVRCHGEDFHYIWDGYPYWPGVYGEDDDQINPGSKTEKIYKSFLLNKNSSQRYGSLSFLESSVAPYSTAFKYQVAFRPNLRLTSKLVKLNGLRIFRKLKDAPGYEKVKYKALALLAHCDSDSVTRDAQGVEVSTDVLWRKIFAAEEQERIEKECKLDEAVLEHKSYGVINKDLFDNQIMQQFIISKNTMLILEKIAAVLGIQTTDWFMASNELRHKNYGTIDLDGRLRHELMIAFIQDLDTNKHLLTKELTTSATCNSPDLNNATIYRSLGFDCRTPKDPERFCSLVTALGNGSI